MLEEPFFSLWRIDACNSLGLEKRITPLISSIFYFTCVIYRSICSNTNNCKTSLVSSQFLILHFFPWDKHDLFCFFFPPCRCTWWAFSVPSPSTPALHCDLVSHWELSFPSVLCMQVAAAILACNVLLLFSSMLFSWEEITSSTLSELLLAICGFFCNTCNKCWFLTWFFFPSQCLFLHLY